MSPNTTDLININPLQFGLVGFVLILMWYVLNVGKTLFLASKERNREADSPLACQQDPLHFQRIREIHEFIKHTGDQVNMGEFSCQWKDREEVRDYIEVAKKQVTALESFGRSLETVSSELRLLRQELVLTRNGNGRRE